MPTDRERSVFETVAKLIVDGDQSTLFTPLMADENTRTAVIRLTAEGYFEVGYEFNAAWLMLTEMGCSLATAAGIDIPWYND